MGGDDRVRYCPECKLSVYNFSEMTDSEVKQIVAQREGRLCARFFKRSDGTLLTRNCPVGLRREVLAAGSYEATIASPGFSTQVLTHVVVPHRDTMKVTLLLGLMGEVVEIPRPNALHRFVSSLRHIF
jgi:hypothetical protein